tara:strand:+ start:8994 stop:9713 length:720 start_codon:yes stop_codon:yes gene_type:complete
MKNQIIQKSLWLVGLFLLSCDSPLSDVEITDPSLIQPVAVISKTTDENGSVTKETIVTIYDKNLSTVELINGSVLINNVELDFVDYAFSGIYELDIPEFGLNQEYNLKIILSDGGAYVGTVTSQSIDLTDVNIPETHNKNEDLTISWGSCDVSSQLSITYNCNEDGSSSFGTIVDNISTEDKNEGEYIISSSDLPGNDSCIESTIFSVVSVTEGTIDDSFRSGSIVKSKIRVSGECFWD